MILTGNGLMVTGTREGMTEDQYDTVIKILPSLFDKYGNVFRHGDCIGVDDEMGNIVSQLYSDVKIFIHPPSNPKYRAFNSFGSILPEEPYLTRDHKMVDMADFFLGFPKGMEQELRSGTWATIRYARKVKRSGMVIYPDGQAVLEEYMY